MFSGTYTALVTPFRNGQVDVKAFEALIDRQQPVAVLCHAGVRSWHFGCWLIQEHGHPQVWNIQGGIEAWSVSVDPAIPRY